MKSQNQPIALTPVPLASNTSDRPLETMSGMEIMCAYRDGMRPLPPMEGLLGLTCTAVTCGQIVLALPRATGLENQYGVLHVGVAATMLDTAMSGAAHTMLRAGSAVTTLDLSIAYLKAVRNADMPAIATGTVLKLSRRTAYVVGELRNREGQLVAHAVGNFSILTL